MEELKKLLAEEKPLLNQVHEDIGTLKDIFVPFIQRMDLFMENMQKFMDRDAI